MKKNRFKYIVLIALLLVSIKAVTQPPPPGLECCDELLEITGDMNVYNECRNSSNPGAYCTAALPVDHSNYFLVFAIGFGIVLASFVIFEIRHKKTPV
ncbi:hypothetical protein [Flavobacterium flavipallidum]|uniref:Uncharacterized protein n=1 Tax=Flavobacterium flavipallidum TaxID=3139140 RepID=A0ABU9HM46_9FLAO